MQDKIIELLKKKEDYVSGEEISHHLKITRQGLWKHIQEMKTSGYEILAVPHLGYKLVSSPDRLFASEIGRKLHTKLIGKKFYYFDEIDSTMDIASQLASKGAVSGTVVVCESQSKGRGRLGRQWVSPKYKGIYASIILRPKLSPSEASILTLLTAVSACEAIKEVAGIDARIKWPNDILLGNKKLGGILLELTAETDEVKSVVIGIGLNVNNAKAGLVAGATSLKEQRAEAVSRVELLQELLRRIESNYLKLEKEGNSHIVEKWRGLCVTIGARVKVVYHNRHIEGHAVNIDKDGGLLVRRDSGFIEKVMSGDIVHCR